MSQAPPPPSPPPPPELESSPFALEQLPSAASLSRLDLPLSPVVTPPVDGSSHHSNAEAAGSSPRTQLHTASSRAYSNAAPLRRPGTEVWAWGRGDGGQLGTGSMEDSHVPTLVEGLKGRDIRSISAGTLHTAAVTGAAATF